ncbi:MAG: FAD-dependent monooxygenase [Crocinitomicaceae bacterium]|nr:FAD-dependent monooxygenase [Crocinitomicaceae bacterium]
MIIDIIGGGIGGLTTAIALEQCGCKVRIFEGAQFIKPVGAGIIIASNAMQVFDRLGLKEEVMNCGNSVSTLNITQENLNLLSRIDLSSFERKFGVKNTAIHRGTLQRILINQIEKQSIFLDHELSAVTKTEDKHILEFTNGKKIESSFIIGADGLNSIVRKQAFSLTHKRSANQICWRGVTDYELPVKHQNELIEAWGRTGRFGFVQIAPKKVYWYALKASSKYKVEEANIQDFFKEFNPLVKKLIQSTKTSDIHLADIQDLKPIRNWCHGTVCLIGDAAHAATPNMGQGACQAIEDAYVLSKCINKYELSLAFKQFQSIRKTKANHVVNLSWTIGKISHWTNPIAIEIRNLLIKIIPNSINKMQLKKLFKLPEI